MRSHEIRKAFLDFFAERGHAVVPSGPLVPANDPTLMFANAGMVQFKDVFTGKDKRPYQRAASSQKCIRISGKHNDLENVGVTARHHTFFEMLGNFSFGDYFKRDAIVYAWDFVTRVIGLPKERLVVSVFGGEDGLPADDEAAAIWKEVAGLGDERIFRLGKKDNFWQMGETGPCGPCSEMHYYVGDGPPDLAKFGDEPGADGVGWTEIWNLVFMQFERHEDGRLDPLPAPSIDTGAGLERMTAAKQGVKSNYETDVLRPLVDLAAKISGKTYRASLEPDDVSMRVIADHARTTAFLMSEGITPDRGGRGYVLRRVMRRAIRHGHRLGIERLFLHECALLVVELMGDVYPDLRERRALIEAATREEEERFRRTLARGLELLAQNTQWDYVDGKKTLPGAVAFELYDTYGFPFDLQEVIGQEQGFAFDHAGFDREKGKAKERSQGSKLDADEAVAAVHHQLSQELGATEFTGYEREHGRSAIVALLRGGERVQRLSEGEEGEVIVKVTPFYAESGGQVGDRGEIRTAGGAFQVTDTQKPVGALVVHCGKVGRGAIVTGEDAELDVDHAARAATRRNHSATHLLHYALRKVLGPQAMQKGSLVGPDRLRFDYSASRPLEADEIARIEDLVNEKILLNAPVETEVLPIDQAKAKGAIGIFEEKYGEVVRMLRMTPDSIELCGGTHAARTGDIGLFKILSDSGIAAGVRRIEAATGANALRWVRELERETARAAAALKTSPAKLSEKVERVLADQRELQRELERTKKQLVSGGGAEDLTARAREVGGVKRLGATVDVDDPKVLRELADQLRDKLAPSVIVLGARGKDGKALLVATVSKELTGSFHSGSIVKQAAQIVGGSGGGRPDFAQAGGPDASKLDDAVGVAYSIFAAPA